MARLEICVATPGDIAAAVTGGAHRIELCAALSVGGLTPSEGLAKAALDICRPAGVAVHAMVRPREGDFAYDDADLALALAEGEALAAAGVDGLVFGAARDGALDRPTLDAWLARFRERRRPDGGALELTLHRAIDLVDDPVAAAADAATMGFDRILSSGGARSAVEGADRLSAIVGAVAGRVRIAAGAGVRPAVAAALLARSGVDELHASASVDGPAPDPSVLAFGFAGGPPRATDAAVVRALRTIVDHTHI